MLSAEDKLELFDDLLRDALTLSRWYFQIAPPAFNAERTAAKNVAAVRALQDDQAPRPHEDALPPTLSDLVAQCPPEVRRHIERFETVTEQIAIQRNVALAALGLPLNATPEQIRERAAALAKRARELEAVTSLALAWRALDESEPIGSPLPNQKLGELALAVDDLAAS